jgi:lactoylglutathione lyase
MSTQRLDHIALLARDPGRSAQFYCDWAGMRLVHDRRDADSGHRVTWVQAADNPSGPSGLIIVIVETEHPISGRGRMDHFGFHVPDRATVDDIADRASVAGILVDGPRDAGPIIGYYCMIEDPDGNVLEFSCEQMEP